MASAGGPSHRKRTPIVTERMQEFRRAHGGDASGQRQHRCESVGCGRTFTSLPGLKYHRKTNHSSAHQKFHCQMCHSSFKSANGLKYHMENKKAKCKERDDNHQNQPCLCCQTNDKDSSTCTGDPSTTYTGDPSTTCTSDPEDMRSVQHTTAGQDTNDDKSRESDCGDDQDIDALYCQEMPYCDVDETDFKHFPNSKFKECGKKVPHPLQLPEDVGGLSHDLKPDALAYEVPGDSDVSSLNPVQLYTANVTRKKGMEKTQNVEGCPLHKGVRSGLLICPDGGDCEDKTGTGDIDMLKEFAIIATSPQSPLMQTGQPFSWDKHFTVEKPDEDGGDGSDPLVTSSSPYPVSNTAEESWSHKWPTAIWQCFIKGTKVRFVDDKQSWVSVEWLARHEELSLQACRQETISGSSFAPNGLLLKDIQCKTGNFGHKPLVTRLLFSPEVDGQSEIWVECQSDHPFFVKDKGWSSLNDTLTAEHYGIPCNKLEEGDVCLPPSHQDATSSRDINFPSNSPSASYTSAVLTLISMKQKNQRECELARKRPISCKPETLKAKRPMNGFMLFAKEHRLEYTHLYPGKDNRSISILLGDKWKEMNTQEKNAYSEKAKLLAEQQKKMHPDCWKRKK